MPNQIEPGSPLGEEVTELFKLLARKQRDWQDAIGFGDEGHRLRDNADFYHRNNMPDSAAIHEANLRNYYIAKLTLVATEAAEAIEELRKNIPITETYYTVGGKQLSIPDAERARGNGVTPKPEGVPSELADIVIRCLSLAGETGIDLGAAIIEKLNYNATRAQKHGGKGI